MTKAEAFEMIGRGFLALAEAEKKEVTVAEPGKDKKKAAVKAEPVKEEKQEAPVAEAVKEEKKYTLEQVRAALAAKSSAGFTAEVKKILENHGATKLSQIDPSEYAAIMEEVG